ncbi:hypothetical protein [Lacrimispora sp.]|jgi:hypothetical protein|uniref:hypothetical protein n=1 Tax=Lacrimispora sp. TaxID=2719234 RepID=UPI0028A7A345|nr:hypothetical protein [Lacrimispora sp.]
MKRELFDNVKLIVKADNAVIDRIGCLSGVLAVSVGAITGNPTASDLSITITHADTEDGTFKPVADAMIGMEEHPSKEGVFNKIAVKSDDQIAINLDLLGCKQFIKITPSIKFTGGSTPAAANASYALVLGDPSISLV